MRTAPSSLSPEIPDLVPGSRDSLAGDHVHLVIAVQMTLVVRIADLLALLQFPRQCSGWPGPQQGRSETSPARRIMPFFDLAGRPPLPGQADQRWARGSRPFEDPCPCSGAKRRLPAIWARVNTSVGRLSVGEDHDGVLSSTPHVLQLLHHDAGPSSSSCAHARLRGWTSHSAELAQRLVFGRKGEVTMLHASRIQPRGRNGFVCRPWAFVDETSGARVADFHRLRFSIRLGILERSGILDSLFAGPCPQRGIHALASSTLVAYEWTMFARPDRTQPLLRIAGECAGSSIASR